MDQPLQEFFAEAEDLIEALSVELRALREQRSEGTARRQIVGRIFRHVHTLKGAAATFELSATSQLAHEVETLLEALRVGKVSLDAAMLDAFDESVIALSETLNQAARRLDTQSPPELIARLQSLALPSAQTSTVNSASEKIESLILPPDISSTLTEDEKRSLSRAVGEGLRVYTIVVSFNLDTFDEGFRALSNALTANGELISTLPDLAEDAPQRIGFRLIYASALSLADVNKRLAPFARARAAMLNSLEAIETTHDNLEAFTPKIREKIPQTTMAPSTAFVRVELSELDELIAATNDLLKETTRALDLAHGNAGTSLEESQQVDEAQMENERGRLYHRFIAVEERLIGLRMIPVAQMFRRAVRAGEVVARLTRKEVDFEMQGGGVRLDKWLADALADPLLHLLRNAVDHGIEAADERRSVGKNGRGRVRLEALASGSRIILRVSDDGRGVDLERVARAAVEAGIVETGATVSPEKSLRLIFRPGFSTAAAVSNISGRGVGLDVVESAVERAGGELRVRSETNAGTTFEINVPSAFAVINVFVVQAGGHSYGLDANCVAEIGEVASSEVERDNSGESLNWHGAKIPLVRLHTLLALTVAEDEAGEQLQVIVIELAEESMDAKDEPTSNTFALVVDGIETRADVLVRTLGRHASRWRGIGGATELPDGTVALMLDLPRLLKTT
jgi:two-component system chemotaxis sensor kinase CheA